MIGRLARLSGLVVAYLSVGTVCAALLGFAWLARSGRFEGERGRQLLALLRGDELPLPAPPEKPAPADAEEAPYAARIEQRARISRDLELRELALDQGLKTVLFEQQKLDEERQRLSVARAGFDQQLKTVRESALSAARSNVQVTLENLTAKQAKQQLLEMMANGQIEYAVSLLAGMPIDKRADILNEFKGGDEPLKLAEILREMGQGDPEAALAERTQAEWNASNPPPPER